MNRPPVFNEILSNLNDRKVKLNEIISKGTDV